MRPKGWDFKHPDYAAAWRQRIEALRHLREHPKDVPILREHYRQNPADFIDDWGVTFDPRNADVGLPTTIPFILFPAQREWIDVVLRKWRAREPLITEKSRDGGFTWLAVSLACTVCLFNEGVAIGFGSRKAEYVDKVGTMKPILPKGRMFMRNLPDLFRGSWLEWRDAPTMRITFPDTGSLIAGEGGDDIGRGDRTSWYFVDESAHIPHPELIDASLSQTTNCRIDVSSVRGMNNSFAQKRHSGKIEVFVFDWKQDPRKDEAWYRKQCEELDPVVVAQEIDRDYSASVEGIVIPSAWVKAAVGARERLGIAPAGRLWGGLDIADEGVDRNAWCGGQGIEVTRLDEWSGKGSDTFASVERAFEHATEMGLKSFRYDADGIGASARGDSRVINEQRRARGQRPITAEAYRGSGSVVDPEGIVDGTIGADGDRGVKNEDYYLNLKAQNWMRVRTLFRNTYRWVVEGKRPGDTDEIISLAKDLPPQLLNKLTTELSQPTKKTNGAGKMLIEKQPDGMKSPNLADALVIGKGRNGEPRMEIPAGFMTEVRSRMMARRR